jgi:glycerophosphoryl diester phosphodiesterase
MGRPVTLLAALGTVGTVLCLAVTLLLWPERSAHAERPAARLASADPSGFAVVAHRGYAGPGVTENTLPAIRRAARYAATAVELDVQLTRDGRLLVLHDATLDRTTTCRGRVDARRLSWVVERCRGRRGGERLPTLAQALDLVVRLGTHVVVDVKRPPSAWTEERYARLVRAIRSRGLQERTLLLGYHRANLEALRALDPALRVQGIADDLADVERMRTWADGVNVPAQVATGGLVEDLRDQGLLVLGRKTGLESDWSALRDAGVDGLLTARVAPYLAWATTPTPTPTATPTV